MYKFIYNLDDNDYLKFNMYHFLNSPVNKNNARFFKWIPSVMFILTAVWVFIDDGDFIFRVLFLICSSVLSIVWLIFYKRFIAFCTRRFINKTKKTGKLPYNKNIALLFEEESIHEQTEASEGRVKYNQIERFVITNTGVYIYIDIIQAYILPLRVFSNSQQLNGFLTFLECKTGVAVEDELTK